MKFLKTFESFEEIIRTLEFRILNSKTSWKENNDINFKKYSIIFRTPNLVLLKLFTSNENYPEALAIAFEFAKNSWNIWYIKEDQIELLSKIAEEYHKLPKLYSQEEGSI